MIRKLALTLILMLSTTLLSATELRFNTRDFFPFSYQVNQRVSGPVADIIREVCKRIDVSCTFKLQEWATSQEEVRQGRADALFVVGWNTERARWLSFSPQILKTEYGFFVAADNPVEYKSNKDISGYTIGVYGPSNTSRLLQEILEKMSKDKTIQPLKIDIRPNEKELLKDLNSSNRTIQAAYANKDVAFAVKKNLGLINLRYAGTQKKLDYFIGFSKKTVDKKLLFRFNSVLVKLHQSGETKKILDYYNIEPGVIEAHIINYYTR